MSDREEVAPWLKAFERFDEAVRDLTDFRSHADRKLHEQVLRLVALDVLADSNEARARLRSIHDLFFPVITLLRRRASAIDDVHYCGALWLECGSEDDQPGVRSQVLKELVARLEAEDAGFKSLRESLENRSEMIAGLLDSYDPSPKNKPGKRGAATLLAELVVLEADGTDILGFRLGPDETHEDAVGRIRRALDADHRSYRQTLKQPK